MAEANEKKESSTTRSLERTLDLLECFIDCGGELSLSELSEKTGFSLSTVHRLANALTQRKYLLRSEHNKKYFLGPKIIELGNIGVSSIQKGLRNLAHPYLAKLHQKFNESIGLYIYQDGCRMCIDRIESTNVLRNTVALGQMIPLTVGAIGNAMLAFLPEETIRQIIPNYTPELQQKLEKIRKDGYYISRGERVPGTFAIAVPVLDPIGSFVCTLSVAGPAMRFPAGDIEETVQYVVDVGRELSLLLGTQEAFVHR